MGGGGEEWQQQGRQRDSGVTCVVCQPAGEAAAVWRCISLMHRQHTLQRAPPHTLTNMTRRPAAPGLEGGASWWMVAINLCSDSKGTEETRGRLSLTDAGLRPALMAAVIRDTSVGAPIGVYTAGRAGCTVQTTFKHRPKGCRDIFALSAQERTGEQTTEWREGESVESDRWKITPQ